METYWMTFRLADDKANRSTYAVRYKELKDVLAWHTAGVDCDEWDAPTSFVMFQSQSAIAAIVADLKKYLTAKGDMFLIRMLNNQTAIADGDCDFEKLKKLMPYVRRA